MCFYVYLRLFFQAIAEMIIKNGLGIVQLTNGKITYYYGTTANSGYCVTLGCS